MFKRTIFIHYSYSGAAAGAALGAAKRGGGSRRRSHGRSRGGYRGRRSVLTSAADLTPEEMESVFRALEAAVAVLEAERRKGAGAMLIRGAANWAEEAGADVLALAVTEANGSARALYEKLGMTVSARYHYRIRAFDNVFQVLNCFLIFDLCDDTRL